MSYTIVIPARYASTRLPGKPLLDIAGKPMLQHVYLLAQQTQANNIWIACDDKKVQHVAKQFSDNVMMTSVTHRSGTERLFEVINRLQLDDNEIVVNVQGDEPCLPPALIDKVAYNLQQHSKASVSTLCCALREQNDIFNPNIVKVVRDQQQYALYFSRAAVPWYREGFDKNSMQFPVAEVYFRHIGLYAYKAGLIRAYKDWSETTLEHIEKLEQLRILYYGHKIYVDNTHLDPGQGVDTEEDLYKARKLLS